MELKTEWDFYFCTVEDKAASIMLDLALNDYAPMKEKPAFIQISVDLNDPNGHGLTKPGEAEILYIMEDRLAEHLATSLGGIYAARNTTGGQRIFYYYCQSSIGYERIIEEVMEGFPNHHYSVQVQKDPDWTFYQEFLYPSKLEFQSILNRRVIEQLEEHGDPLEQAREVEHFLFFKTDQDRALFLEKIQHDRFRIISKQYESRHHEHPFSLIIAREELVSTYAIDEIVFYLMDLADAYSGSYDGWGTGVMLE